MLGRTTAALAVAVVVVATLIAGCMRATPPQSAAQVSQLIEHIETVTQWSRGADRAQHTAWLDRAIAWDLVGAVDMTGAADKIDASRVDAILRSGLNELAAGPGDHIATLVAHWHKALGDGSYRSAAATDDEVRWAPERLALPVPKTVGPEVRKTLAGYADRAKDAHDFVRIDGSAAAHLVVGVVGDRLVPLQRE
jgi:hypothetical protein